MDVNAKYLKIPSEMAVYAEKHKLFELMQSLVRNLIIHRPADPIPFLIALLKMEGVHVPRVVLLGPPSSGKSTVAKKLCERIGAIHITLCSILKDNTDLTRAGELYTHLKREIPVHLLIKLLQERLSKPDCMRQGWVLDGIPKTRAEAIGLQDVGIIADHVVMFQAPDSVLLERSLGKRIDPVTGDIYHMTFMWPECDEVAERLEMQENLTTEEEITRQLQVFQRETPALQATYDKLWKIINADQPPGDVFTQVLNYTLSRHRSSAPYSPRALLFGPPGSGKSLNAKLLAEKYGIINVCCGELLKAAAEDDGSVGELIKPYLESGQQVPNKLMMQIVTDRLSRLDCTTQGWILHEFPQDLKQAEALQESNFTPNRVFFLEMSDELAIERLTLRAVDPETGIRYHSRYNPAPNAHVQARLQYNPQDSESEVKKRLEEYRCHEAALQAFYPQGVRVKADLILSNVFESLESGLVGSPPDVLPEFNSQALSGSSRQ